MYFEVPIFKKIDQGESYEEIVSSKVVERAGLFWVEKRKVGEHDG